MTQQQAEPALASVRRFAQWVPACEQGRHLVHPGMTCDQADRQIEADEAYLARVNRTLDRLLGPRTPIAAVPEALRGPRWTPAP